MVKAGECKMPNYSQYDREEQAIYDAYERGDITAKQMREELRELQRDWQGAAEEAAWDAYNAELDYW